MKIAGALLLALVLSAASVQSSAQITGPLRDQFTASFKASCLKTQKASPLNQKTTDNLLMEYCACNAAYFADRVTPDQLAMSADAAAKGVRPSWFADYSGAASAYCSRDISRYMTVAS